MSFFSSVTVLVVETSDSINEASITGEVTESRKTSEDFFSSAVTPVELVEVIEVGSSWISSSEVEEIFEVCEGSVLRRGESSESEAMDLIFELVKREVWWLKKV